MSVSSIGEKNKYLLWVKSGGRCQFRGCNKSLTQDILTKRNFNQSYIAHIVADKPNGPRGCIIRSKELADDITNLMLLCDSHHRLIDRADVEGHPESLLLVMKKEHEDRMERITAISVEMNSHIVVYKANVGNHTPVITFESTRQFLLPDRYPATSHIIDLSLTNSPQRDRDAAFWQTEIEVLEAHFNQRLKQGIQKQEIRHISLFAFAPIPLLIKLGTLINDIQHIEVHQPVRAPKTWNLSDNPSRIKYCIEKPKFNHSVVALNISLSGTITDDQITDVLGDSCSIYTLTIPSPFNDYLKNKVHLEDFSITVRTLLNEIKASYGATSELNVFPAMPIAAAIELGRVWMPKVDMPLVVYDANSSIGGFVKALEIQNS